MAKVAFIGLGVMGGPMAGHLVRGGHDVSVFDANPDVAKAWADKYNGTVHTTPATTADGCDFVFMCVGNDDHVRSVVYGDDGVFATLQKGAILVDHTTASADLEREIHAAAADHNIGYLDAPISGGQVGSEAGQLSVMCGGEQATFDKAHDVIACYAKSVKLIGGAGAGQLCKMVSQICLAGMMQGLAEGIHFGQKSDLDMDVVFDAIKNGAARSWALETGWERMNRGEYDYGFAVDWMRKDLGMCFQETENNGAHLPVMRMIDSYFENIQQDGGNRYDFSSLLLHLNKQ